MPCYQSTNLPSGFSTTGRTTYTTEAECNQACLEGACCEGTTCSVKPACQCQGAGQVFRGVGTTCSPNPCNPCGCSNEQQLQSLKNCVINLTFSDFGPTQRLGLATNLGSCDCDAQYGFSGSTIMSQTAFLGEWASHFNSISAQLSFQRADSGSIFWAGDSGSMSKPGGGTVTYFFGARLDCFNVMSIYRDEDRGCQLNSGFASKTGSVASGGPMAFAPGSFSTRVVNSAIVAQCGNVALSAQFQSLSTSQVFCAGSETTGCFGAANCGSSYYRAGFSGSSSASVSANPLP
jgi:hypothetical protein